MQDSTWCTISAVCGCDLYRADKASHLYWSSGWSLHADVRGKGAYFERRDLASEQRDSGKELPNAGACCPVRHAAGDQVLALSLQHLLDIQDLLRGVDINSLRLPGSPLHSVSFHCRKRWHSKAVLQVEGIRRWHSLVYVCSMYVFCRYWS